MILSNSGSTPVVPKRTAKVDPELFLRLKHGVIVDIDSTVLHLEPRAQERFKFAARDQLFAHLSLEKGERTSLWKTCPDSFVPVTAGLLP